MGKHNLLDELWPPRYIGPIFPSFILGDRLSDEESRTLSIVWGLSVSMMLQGREPVFRQADLVLALMKMRRVRRSAAEEPLRSLLRKREYLIPVLPPEGATGRGRWLGLGPKFAPFLEAVRRIVGKPTDGFPTIVGKPTNAGKPAIDGKPSPQIQVRNPLDKGGGFFDTVPPPEIRRDGGVQGGKGSENRQMPENRQLPEKQQIPPAILGLAQRAGMQTEGELEDLMQAVKRGVGPGSLAVVWQDVLDSGAGNPKGAFRHRLRSLVPELAPEPTREVTRFCPVCGAEVKPYHGVCEGGHQLRTCECGELAPWDRPCPWCGMLPPEQEKQLAEMTEPEELPEPDREFDPDAQELWQAALSELRLKMARGTFDTWLKGTEGVTLDGDTLMVAVANEFARDWLENRLISVIKRTIASLAGRELEVRFVVRSNNGGLN